MLSVREILETIRMVQQENLDIRTITMGISLRDCAHSEKKVTGRKIYDKITGLASNLVRTGEEIERDYGIPIVNKRISVTPMSMVAESCETDDYVYFAEVLEKAAAEVQYREWVHHGLYR